MNYQRQELRDQLAAAYVLGTLRGGARHRFERLLIHDRTLQSLVAHWTERLIPIGAASAQSHPSPRVWEAIERRIDAGTPQQARVRGLQRWFGWLTSKLIFARVALLALMLGIVAPVVQDRFTEEVVRSGRGAHNTGTVPEDPPRPTLQRYVAFLVDANGMGGFLVQVPGHGRDAEVAVLRRFPLNPDESLQLWALRPDASPQALGTIALGQNMQVALPTAADQFFRNDTELAISVERRGPAQLSAPTLPYLSRGPVLKAW